MCFTQAIIGLGIMRLRLYAVDTAVIFFFELDNINGCTYMQ